MQLRVSHRKKKSPGRVSSSRLLLRARCEALVLPAALGRKLPAPHAQNASQTRLGGHRRCQISEQTFFFLDLNNCIASPALLLLCSQPQMTFGRPSVVCSHPPPRGAFSDSPSASGSLAFKPAPCSLSLSLFFVQVSNFIQFKFYSISGYKICKSGFESAQVLACWK